MNNIPKIRFRGFTDAWEQRKFSNIYNEVLSGNRLSKADTIEGEVPYIVAQTKNNGVCAYITKEQKDFNNNPMKLFPANSITFSIDNPEAIFVQNEPFFTSNIMRVLYKKELTKGTVYSISEMLKKLTHSYNWSFKFSGPVVMNSAINVPVNTFGEINFEELDIIGNIFFEIDNLITLHQRKLEKTQNLKKAMLEKMFPKNGESVPEIRFAGFTEAWEQRKLGDIADVTKLAGFEFTEHVVYSDEGNIIALRGLNIKNGKLVLDDVKYIDGSNFSKLNRSKLFIDDIMFTYVGTVGEVAIIKENDRFYLAPNVSRIRVQSNDSPKFISHYMRTKSFYRHIIFPLIATSSQPALSMENIRKFEICLPKNRDEQDRLSELFDGIDNLITLHQRKLEKLQNIKKSMLEKMFV